MSLEQSFSKKLTLGPAGSQQQQDGLGVPRGKSPSSTDSSPKSSPSKSKKLSLKGLGRSNTSAKRSRSPICRQQTLQECSSSSTSKKDKKVEDSSKSSTFPNAPDLGEYIPGTSGPPGVDHSPFYEAQGKPSGANKIIFNWKSACGRTKDKTKDFIRRWKTLPENHPDFEAASTSRSPPGSSTNIAPTVPPASANSSVSLFQSQQQQQQPQYAGDQSSSNTIQASSSGGNNNAVATGMGKLKNLTKKQSEIEVPFSSLSLSVSGGQGGSNKSSFANGPIPQEDNNMQANGTKSSWTVHVWSTYVQRDDDLEFPEENQPARELLSEFQKIKLSHFFSHVLDMNHDGVISAEDFVCLNQRIRHYIEWSSECIEFHILKEVHSGFLECFLNKPLDSESTMYYCDDSKEKRSFVNIELWLDIWGSLLNSARTMESLPLWLQYFPKILFQVINKSGSGTISKEELRAFYTMFLGIDFRVVNDTLDSIYNAMTDTGRNKITYGLYKLCFANFLLGKFPHGPGQFLFGICAPATLSCAFPIDYSALNTPKDDLEVYDPDKDKGQTNRRSVIV